MKKLVMSTIVISIIFIALTASTEDENKYYYAFDKKVKLISKSDKLLIKKTDGTDKKSIKELIKSETRVKFKWLDGQVAEVTLNEGKKLKRIKDLFKNSSKVASCHPLYILEDGLKMGVTDEILLRFLPEVPAEDQDELIKHLGLTKMKETRVYEKYRVKKGADALALAGPPTYLERLLNLETVLK